MPYKPRPILIADQLRIRYGMTEPPINAGLVIFDYPVRVVLRDWNSELSGVFVRGKAISHIGLNANHPVERRNFTLWHEFYHFLEHKDVLLCEDNQYTVRSRLEQEADLFAANLLMPEEWVREYFARFKGNCRALARRFGVSITAMEIRLQRFGLEDDV